MAARDTSQYNVNEGFRNESEIEESRITEPQDCSPAAGNDELHGIVATADFIETVGNHDNIHEDEDRGNITYNLQESTPGIGPPLIYNTLFLSIGTYTRWAKLL